MPDRALYVYAVVPLGTRVGTTGVGQEPVEVLVSEGLGMVVSDISVYVLAAVEDPDAIATLAQQHDAVVRAAMAATDAALPFRLGTVLRDREAARAYLVEREDELRAALDHVAACREWCVTVRDRGAKAEAPASGTAYLAKRRAALAEADGRRRAGAEVVAELRRHAVAASAGRRDGVELLLDESFLVRGDAEAAFLEAVDACGDRLDALGLALHVTGPWPPYSFAPSIGEVEFVRGRDHSSHGDEEGED